MVFLKGSAEIQMDRMEKRLIAIETKLDVMLKYHSEGVLKDLEVLRKHNSEGTAEELPKVVFKVKCFSCEHLIVIRRYPGELEVCKYASADDGCCHCRIFGTERFLQKGIKKEPNVCIPMCEFCVKNYGRESGSSRE